MVPGWPGLLWEPPPMFSQITELRFFLRKWIFCVLGPKKLFWTKKTLFSLGNPTFGGVIFLKLIDPSYSFEVVHFEIAIFSCNSNLTSTPVSLLVKSKKSSCTCQSISVHESPYQPDCNFRPFLACLAKLVLDVSKTMVWIKKFWKYDPPNKGVSKDN